MKRPHPEEGGVERCSVGGKGGGKEEALLGLGRNRRDTGAFACGAENKWKARGEGDRGQRRLEEIRSVSLRRRGYRKEKEEEGV